MAKCSEENRGFKVDDSYSDESKILKISDLNKIQGLPCFHYSEKTTKEELANFIQNLQTCIIKTFLLHAFVLNYI